MHLVPSVLWHAYRIKPSELVEGDGDSDFCKVGVVCGLHDGVEGSVKGQVAHGLGGEHGRALLLQEVVHALDVEGIAVAGVFRRGLKQRF